MHHAVAMQVSDADAQLVHKILCSQLVKRMDIQRTLRACTTAFGSGLVGPRPVRSMYFLRSVSRYSKTCKDQSEDMTSRADNACQVQHGLAILLYVLDCEKPVDMDEEVEGCKRAPFI